MRLSAPVMDGDSSLVRAMLSCNSLSFTTCQPGCHSIMKLLVHLWAVLLFLSGSAMAGELSPADVARQYNTLSLSGQYAKAFALRDAEDLKIERLSFVRLLARNGDPNVRTRIFGEHTENDIAAMSDMAFLEAIYTAFMDESRRNPEMAVNVIVLGTAFDGENTAYVICKNVIVLDAKATEVVDLVRLKKVGGGWSVGLPSEAAGLIEGMAAGSNQSAVDFMTENEEPENDEVQVLERKPDNAVVIDEISVEFTSSPEGRKQRAVQELRKRAYILAGHAITDIEIEEVQANGLFVGGHQFKARAKVLVFKKR
jgi:hypothetical protein